MDTMNGKLAAFLSEHGLKACTVDYMHSLELVEEIEERRASSGLSDAIFKRYLARFREKFAESSKYKTIIILAAPQEPGILEFVSGGKVHPVIIPPTYVYGDSDASVERLMRSYLEPLGYVAERAVLPNKLLAVRSGLGSYGRDNICYVPGFGSFVRLIPFYTDMPCDKDSWQEARTMERCSSCKICVRNCPTGCISDERFLIHAEKCLTHLNENGGSFPEWLNPAVHNAIVGCMDCQKQCPNNKGLMNDIQVLERFGLEETDMILQQVPYEELPAALKAKLERLTLAEYYDVLPRNLKVLIDKDR